METAVLIFDDVTALDVVGPTEILSKLPGMTVKYVAAQPGVKKCDGGLGIVADFSLEDVPTPDVVLIPGGKGIKALLGDTKVIGWVRSAHENSKWTASVCTGAIVLGAAGILKGLRATTHWLALEHLGKFGAIACSERVVIDGKIISSAGVSAGIDMALTLAGRIAGPNVAKAIQLAIEYDPKPPFDAGSPDKAPPEIVEMVRRKAAERSR
ncbi:MAG: DJ-1/PfpI family protein [Sedimentisphaerales bacterium]|jgi:transcriptional regulator GlxA family with amidase domain